MLKLYLPKLLAIYEKLLQNYFLLIFFILHFLEEKDDKNYFSIQSFII